MRAACLLVPNLPLAAELRAHPEFADQPLGVATGPGPRAELIAVSPEAARRGVRPRASVAHARAVCAELIVRVASPALELAARAALLDAALSVSPRAAGAPRSSGAFAAEAAVYLDASGVEALFRSESGFAAALGARAQRLGLPGNTAVASSRNVAHIAARQLAGPGETCVLPPGTEAAFLAPLPIDMLDPEDTLANTLTRFGVTTVNDLLALPRRPLGTRLGPRVLQLIELAQGRETDTPLSVPDTGRLTEAIDLEFPVDRLEPLTFVIQGLLSRLLERLEARHLACSDLVLTLQQEGRAHDSRRIGSAAPTLDLRVLVRLVCHALESRPPRAPVESVALETEGRPLPSDQLDLFRPAGPAPAVLSRTLAELEALCGEGRIGSPQIANSNHPDAFGMAPFQPSEPRTATPPEQLQAGMLAIRALRPPLCANVRVSRGLPEVVHSAIANGRVIQIAGPWRSTGSWWSREGRYAYDSFDIQTSDGTVSRLRLDHLKQSWHIDAVYD
jgi:protein ImuB